MEDEKNLMDWVQWPLLILIAVTPLRFALEVGGVPKQITEFFSSTAFVCVLAAYLGIAMAIRTGERFRRLLAVGFTLGCTSGFMVLIATLLSTYASIETHYRHHRLDVSDAKHILITHLVVTPLVTSVVACFIVSLVFFVTQKIMDVRRRARKSAGDLS
jgi:hypothetical protein